MKYLISLFAIMLFLGCEENPDDKWRRVVIKCTDVVYVLDSNDIIHKYPNAFFRTDDKDSPLTIIGLGCSDAAFEKNAWKRVWETQECDTIIK